MRLYHVLLALLAMVHLTGCQRTLSKGPFGTRPAYLPESATDGIWFIPDLADSSGVDLQVVVENSTLGEASGSLFETKPGAGKTSIHPWLASVRSGPDGHLWVTAYSFGDKADIKPPYYPFLLIGFRGKSLKECKTAYAWLPHTDRVVELVKQGVLPGKVQEGTEDLKLEEFSAEQKSWLAKPENLARFIDWEHPIIALRKSRAELEKPSEVKALAK